MPWRETPYNPGVPARKPHPLAALVAKRIKQVREAKGLTQEALGKLMGCSQKWVGDIERARTTPQLDTLDKFAQALSVQPFELLLPEAPRAEIDTKHLLGMLKRCDDRARQHLSAVMESFVDYKADRKV